MPHTNPSDIDTTVKLSNDQYKVILASAEANGQLSAIDASNTVGLPAHLAVLATGWYTCSESLDLAYAFVRTRLAKRKAAKLFAGYTGTPKAIWATRNGLPSDMGGRSKAHPNGNPANSYHPNNAGKRKGLPDTAVIVMQRKGSILDIKPTDKVRLYPNGVKGTKATRGNATSAGSDAQRERRAATNAANKAIKAGSIEIADAEALVARIRATFDGASKQYVRNAEKRIGQLETLGGIVARGNGRTATGSAPLSPSERIQRAEQLANEQATTPSN